MFGAYLPSVLGRALKTWEQGHPARVRGDGEKAKWITLCTLSASSHSAVFLVQVVCLIVNLSESSSGSTT